MQGKQVPFISGQTELSQQSRKFDESALIPIASQVSFGDLLKVIESLTTTQKLQIYQLLGVQLYPQPPQAKLIEQKSGAESQSKLTNIIEDDTQTDEEALNSWLTARGYQNAEG